MEKEIRLSFFRRVKMMTPGTTNLSVSPLCWGRDPPGICAKARETERGDSQCFAMDRGAYPPGGCVNGREGRGMGQPARFHQGQMLPDQSGGFL